MRKTSWACNCRGKRSPGYEKWEAIARMRNGKRPVRLADGRGALIIGRMPGRRKKLSERAMLDVADRVHSAAIHLLRGVRVVDARTGLSGPRLSALSVLVLGGTRTLGELAAAEQVKAPTMTRLVDAMEAEGLVKRGGDAKDARKRIIVATAKGARLLKDGRRRRVAELVRRMRGLSDEEMQCLGKAAGIMEELSQ